ncbi:MAG TPA: peptide deformylase [Polyangiaceae bacterium]|nr:peptide deformylase [Polyangiaceae bacterium]
MAIRKIAQLGEPVLRVPARRLEREEIQSAAVRALVADMVETMRDADGAGLAAPQVYESLQLCVIELANNPRYPNLEPIPLITLINPVLTPLVSTPVADLPDTEAMFVYEGCLSVPGLRGRVRRPRKVRVQALGAAGEALDFVWEGFRAAVVQHEVDHLNATLFVDRALPGTLTFLREYERHVPKDTRVVDGAVASTTRG